MNSVPMNTVLLGLGSNLGDKLAHLRVALSALKATPGIHEVQVSSVYLTPPWGAAGSPAFLNACALIKTSLPLDAVLGVCLGIALTSAALVCAAPPFAPASLCT